MTMIHRFTLPVVRSIALITLILVLGFSGLAQSLSAGTVSGTVTDPNNAVVPNATITIENSVTGYRRTATTGMDGKFRFDSVPFNNYVFSASAPGFNGVHGSWNIRSSVPTSVNIPLTVGAASEIVTVSTAGELIENDP